MSRQPRPLHNWMGLTGVLRVTGAGQPWRVRSSSLWVGPVPVLQFHEHRGNWGGLVMSICNFVGSALFILSVSILKVAHTFPGTSITLGIFFFLWDASSSISRVEYKEHKRSGSGYLGNSKVRSPLETKCISPLSLERSLPRTYRSRPEGVFLSARTQSVCAGRDRNSELY